MVSVCWYITIRLFFTQGNYLKDPTMHRRGERVCSQPCALYFIQQKVWLLWSQNKQCAAWRWTLRQGSAKGGGALVGPVLKLSALSTNIESGFTLVVLDRRGCQLKKVERLSFEASRGPLKGREERRRIWLPHMWSWISYLSGPPNIWLPANPLAKGLHIVYREVSLRKSKSKDTK